MSRTYAGYLFRCKHCGELHLLDQGEPRDEIVLPCVGDKRYIINTYKETDFKFWHGLYWDVCDVLVQENKPFDYKEFLKYLQKD